MFNAIDKLPQGFQAKVFKLGPLPTGLEFLVSGSPGHAEVVPTAGHCGLGKTWMKLNEYQALLNQIHFSDATPQHGGGHVHH